MSLALIPPVPAASAASAAPADLAAAASANEATWGEAMRRLCALRFADALELFVDDPCVRLVGAAPGAPSVVRGRPSLLATWQGLGAAVRHAAYHQLAFHQTVDPDVVFVERRTDLTLRSGQVVSMSALDRVRFRDGRIAELTEHLRPGEHERVVRAVHDLARMAG
jgi:ketosteroid isomerase-like protein